MIGVLSHSRRDKEEKKVIEKPIERNPNSLNQSTRYAGVLACKPL